MAAPATFILSSRARRDHASQAVSRATAGCVVEIHPPTRTTLQNRRLHAMITDVSEQIDWPTGSGVMRDIEAWKDIFTAALRSANHGLDVVPGLNGGFVLLGMHTSKMTVSEVGDLMTLIEAFGAERGIVFSDPTPSPAAQGTEAAKNRLREAV